MTPAIVPAYPTLKLTRTRRSAADKCAGWSCLSDAAQYGVILVIIAVVLALGYIYWRLQVVPKRQLNCGEDRASNDEYLQFHREGPNRVSITIHREPRTRDSEGDEETKGTKGRAPRRRKGKNEPAQLDEGMNDPPQPTGNGSPSNVQPVPSDIHIIPPPPPIVWAVAPPSLPPPPFGPPTFLFPGPPPPPFISEPPGPYPTTGHYPPYAPPYLAQHGLQNLHQAPMPGIETVAPPGCIPAPARWPDTSNNHHKGAARQPPSPKPQPRQRRWFSMGAVPQTGHARTVSGSDSPTPRSRSPSPAPPPVSPPSPNRGRGRLRNTSDRRLRRRSSGRRPKQQSLQPRRKSARSGTQDLHQDDSLHQSSVDPGSTNTSVEAVDGSRESSPGHRARVHRSPNPGRRRYSDGGPRVHQWESDAAPLLDLSQRRRRSPGRRAPPSPDIQFPSPEPRRANVSFSIPSDSDDVATSSARK